MTQELLKSLTESNSMNREAVLFSGYARLPSGTVSSEVYGIMALVVLLDVETETIIAAECTLSTRLAERFVSSLLVGRSFKNGPQELVDIIDELYQGAAKKAIVTAIRIVSDRYRSFVIGRSL